MQTVSDSWKNAHRQTILNESFVEVSLGIADPEALADASSQDNGSVYISDTPQIVSEANKNIVPYCTLEQNLWLLDGGRKAIPESDYGDCGYISDAMSDDTCVFSAKMPVITINFSKVFTNLIPGITITWSEAYSEFADEFIVRAYNDTNLVAEKEVIGNRSVKSLIILDIINYTRIEILVKKWCLPNHRARVEEIFIGLDKVYGKGELFDYSHTQSVDPVSTSLPKFEIKFSVDNVDGEYNPYNESGLAKYLMERQEIKARYGLKMDDGSIEWIKAGTFYLSEWYAKQNGLTADFTARDLLEFMFATYYDTEFAENTAEILANGRTLAHLAESVLTSANLPGHTEDSPKWYIDPSLAELKTTAPLPEDTHANCLQLIANAGMCVVYQNREGVLRVEPLSSELLITDYKIDSFNSYSKPEITLTKPIKQVTIKQYRYTQGANGIESTYNMVISKIGEQGEILEVDNPLITENYSIRVATWMAEHVGHRMTLDSSWRADVRLDALDIVTNENSYGSNRVRITDVEFKYNGAFRGTGKGKVI